MGICVAAQYARIRYGVGTHRPSAPRCMHLPPGSLQEASLIQGVRLKRKPHEEKHIFVDMQKGLVIGPLDRPLAQGDGNSIAEPDRHHTQGVARRHRLSPLRNIPDVSPSQMASPGSADVEVSEFTARGRERCLCMSSSVPKFLRGRGHYRCVMGSFLCVADREQVGRTRR